MFDVIDVQKCRDTVIERFNRLALAISEGRLIDPFGGRMATVTMDEAYALARNAIGEMIQYDASLAPRYLAQFPEILGMELVGSTVSDSLEQGLRRAVFGRIEADVREAIVAQFADYGLDELSRSIAAGLAMFDKYLTKDPYAPLRIRPAKVLKHLAAVIEDAGKPELRLLIGQIGNLVSELKSRPSDAKHAARALREAGQYCSLLLSDEIVEVGPAEPALLAMAS